MGIYRTYFDKNNTIIRDSKINTGRNQISELFYGDKVSRLLFYCSFNELKNKVANKDIIIINANVKHYLKIKNTSNFDVTTFLSDSNNLVFSDKYRSSSFDLELRPVKELWDEGMGYDFEQSPLSRPQDRNYSEEASNWTHRTTVNTFATPGGTLGDVIANQHFDKGNEDIFMDISNFVNDILINGVTTGTTTGTTTGITQNYEGFCLKYTQPYETVVFDDKRSYVLGLFTKHTQTFFEPFIETVYDDYIDDNRVEFYLNKVNKLYLYVNIDGQMTNLDYLPTCTINGVTYQVKQKTRGVYYVEVFADGNVFDSYVEYHDIWSNISVNGVNRSDIRLKFITKEENDYYQIGSDIMEPMKYGVSLSGIMREEKVYQDENRKVYVHLRKPYTVEQKDVVSNVYYKLYIKQGGNKVEVLDWQPVNKTYNSNSFNIDSTWLVPQVYFVDIKVERNGEINIYNEELKFIVPSKMNG
jgi:hypothetical protein